MSLQAPGGADFPKARARPRLALIVPVFNEARVAAALAERLTRLAEFVAEIAVIDGGSSDETLEILDSPVRWPRLHRDSAQLRITQGPRGRARQMNAGAGGSQADVLVFLHADTEFWPAHVLAIEHAVSHGADFGCFGLRIASPDPRLRLAARLISLRSRLIPSATGDQAIFIRRPLFEQLGGYPEIPLCEDLALIQKARRHGRYACLEPPVVTSSRRWEQSGVWRTILLMWLIRLGSHAGIAPQTLKRIYDDVR